MGLAATTTSTSVDNDVSKSLIALLVFGAVALIVLTVLYVLQGGKLGATFARMYGLILVAVLGVSLSFANVSDTAKTAAFTLLGTVAGYLAGAQTKTSKDAGGDGGGGDAGVVAGAPPAEPSAAGELRTWL